MFIFGWLILAGAGVASALEPPTNVTATAGAYTNQIALTWGAAVGASDYQVFRNTNDLPETAVELITTTNLYYDDADVVPGVYYHYWVKAGNDTTNSVFSAGAMGYCRLAAPRGLVAGAGTLFNAVALSWEPTAHAVEYQVWRHTATNAAAAAVLLTNTVATDCLDNSARPARHYVYRVRAVAESGIEGEFSDGAEGWRRMATACDYDGDGRADLVLYNAVAASWQAYLSGDNYVEVNLNFGGRDFVAIAADYDGDGKADPAVYREQDGLWAALLSSEAYRFITFRFGGKKFRPLAGDYDGDGKADPALYNEEQGLWRVCPSSMSWQEVMIAFGGRGWRPAPADYDGDGLTDPAIYHEGQGVWQVLSSAAQYAPVQALFGGPQYRPAPADYDGDGKVDPALYHVETGQWLVMMSSAQYRLVSAFWGGRGWRPAPADYDGDGKADPMVRQVSSGRWRVIDR
jgi:hypothetical protein